MRVLLAEDDSKLARLIHQGLGELGMRKPFSFDELAGLFSRTGQNRAQRGFK